MDSVKVLLVSILILLVIGITIAFYLTGCAIITWSWQINPLWGIVTLFAWLMLLALLKVIFSTQSSSK